MDRRHFMGLGGMGALLGVSAAEAAALPAAFSGKTILDFGVSPDSPLDQSAAMQKAIEELAGSGQPSGPPITTQFPSASDSAPGPDRRYAVIRGSTRKWTRK